MAKYSKSDLEKAAKAKGIDTNGLSDEQLFTAVTGLVYAKEAMEDENSDWYVPKGAYISDNTNTITEPTGTTEPTETTEPTGTNGPTEEPINENKGTKIDSWTLIDHRNFGDSEVQAKLADYYTNYPAEAAQDGTEWPPFTASKFPWFLINYNFDGETEVNVYYQGEKVFEGWTPTAQVEQESGAMVARTYCIISVPEDFTGLAEYIETVEGTDKLLDAADFEVYLVKEETNSELEPNP